LRMQMEPTRVLEQLEDLALKLGIEVVYEKLEPKDPFTTGGLCKVKGKYKILIDPSYTIDRRVEILSRALSAFEHDEVYVLPYIREILERAKQSGRA
jgi:hypothetical protein